MRTEFFNGKHISNYPLEPKNLTRLQKNAKTWFFTPKMLQKIKNFLNQPFFKLQTSMIAQNDRNKILSFFYLLHFFPGGLEKLENGKTISEPTSSASLLFMICIVCSSQELDWHPQTGLTQPLNAYLKCLTYNLASSASIFGGPSLLRHPSLRFPHPCFLEENLFGI